MVHGGDNFAAPVNTDGTGVADYLDADSDDDGIDDAVESGLTALLSGNDNDGDGIDDALSASYSDPGGIIDDPFNDLENIDSEVSEPDYRSINAADTDNDGVSDVIDLSLIHI